MLLDDYVAALAVAIIVASVVVLGTFLSRYNELVQEADRSTRLAKDVWDSVNARFSVVDGRIIDLMARTEVISSRITTDQSSRVQAEPKQSRDVTQNSLQKAPESVRIPVGTVSPVIQAEGTETEMRVLRFLVDGPKSSAEIKEALNRSREHTARLMKGLFDRGLVVRSDRKKPYVYEITESGRSYIVS